MRRTASSLACALVFVIWLAGPSLAKEPALPDNAARAKFISRFLTGEAIAVGRLDVRRLKVEPLFAEFKRLTGGDNAASLEHTQVATEDSVQQFLTAGGREAYAIFVLGFSPTLVIPVPAGADSATIMAILAQGPFEATEQIDGAIVAGRQAAVDRLKTSAATPRPQLEAAFAAAGETTAQLLVLPSEDQRKVIEQLMPRLPKEIGGGSTQPLARGLEWAALGIDTPPQLGAKLTLSAADEASARALQDLIQNVFDTLGQNPELLKQLPTFPEIVKLLTPEPDGKRLVVQLDTASGRSQKMAQLLQGPIAAARDQARQMQSFNNLKQLALALHNYHDVNNSFPAAVSSKDGKPLLSWRVVILPYLDANELYKKFHLDEPWDSPHNQGLIADMPVTLQSPFSKLAGQGRTVYLAPRGKDTVFPGQEAVKISTITDGTSNTIMLVEADDEHAVVWTKPDDWEADVERPQLGLRQMGERGFTVGFADGSVQNLPAKIKADTLRALLTRGGGEVIGPNDR